MAESIRPAGLYFYWAPGHSLSRSAKTVLVKPQPKRGSLPSMPRLPGQCQVEAAFGRKCILASLSKKLGGVATRPLVNPKGTQRTQ